MFGRLKMVMGLAAVSLGLMAGRGSAAQEGFIYGDPMPAAPQLAARGSYGVGVRTVEVVNPDQMVVRGRSDGSARADRPLTLEVWYPAAVDSGVLTEYSDVLPASAGAGEIPFTFAGRAARDAAPDAAGAPYPLIVVSHGYPGSRVQLTYLTENLASKGYVVVAIGHTDSTFADAGAFENTLVNRAPDIRFTIDQMAAMGLVSDSNSSFLSGLVDAENTGLVGFSMGGYGSLNVVGAGYSAMVQAVAGSAAAGLLADNAAYPGADVRVKALFTFAPFGADLRLLGAGGARFWDDEAVAQIGVPVFFVAGTHDDVAGYENGVRHLFEAAAGAERYLLTYENARHNVGGNPPPPEAASAENWFRYGEPAWDTRTLNNIAQHFATAFFGVTLKGESDMARYLTDNWRGFADRSAVGLRLERKAAGE